MEKKLWEKNISNNFIQNDDIDKPVKTININNIQLTKNVKCK